MRSEILRKVSFFGTLCIILLFSIGCNPCKRAQRICPPQIQHDTTILIRERIVEVLSKPDTVILTQDVIIKDSSCIMEPVKYENQYVKVEAKINDGRLDLNVRVKEQKLFVTITDTVKTYSTETIHIREVEKLTWWQRIKLKFAEIALIIAVLFAVIMYIKSKL